MICTELIHNVTSRGNRDFMQHPSDSELAKEASRFLNLLPIPNGRLLPVLDMSEFIDEQIECEAATVKHLAVHLAETSSLKDVNARAQETLAKLVYYETYIIAPLSIWHSAEHQAAQNVVALLRPS